MRKTLLLALLLALPTSVFAQGAVSIAGPLDGSGNVAVSGSLTGAKTNDNAAPGADLVPVAGAIASSAAQAYTTGRLVLPRVNLFGHAGVFFTDATTGAAMTPATDVVEDAAETAGGSGPMVMTVRRDTAASSAGASGDNATANTDNLGRMWTRPGTVCSDPARVSDAKIDTATSGNVELVALNGSDVFYVCGYNFIASGAVSVQFISGTGSACATGETDETGPYAAAANGGIAIPNTGAVQFTTAAGAALCIELSGAVQVSGIVTYVRTAAP